MQHLRRRRSAPARRRRRASRIRPPARRRRPASEGPGSSSPSSAMRCRTSASFTSAHPPTKAARTRRPRSRLPPGQRTPGVICRTPLPRPLTQQARRSISFSPPQMPCASRTSSEYSRHSSQDRASPADRLRDRLTRVLLRALLEVAGREEVRRVLASARARSCQPLVHVSNTIPAGRPSLPSAPAAHTGRFTCLS